MEAATKEILKGFLEKAEKKLEVAEKLFRSGDYEDSVSRAYYAVFARDPRASSHRRPEG